MPPNDERNAATPTDRVNWKRANLVDDERGRGFPAVVRYGPYFFVSGSDGHRRLSDERIDPESADNADTQCRNSYGRVARRLEQAGYGGDCAVWIENFTSGQHWRLQRMGLWPEYFGEENHQQAVSFGAQTRMHGINMLTSVVLAMDPSLPRTVAVKPPGRGRASRITRVGPLVFVIGVRGHEDPRTGTLAPEESDDAFDAQLDNCIHALGAHLSKDGTPMDNVVRMDATLRAARFVPHYEERLRTHFGGKIPFASYAVGTPLGARLEQEIGCVAVVEVADKRILWSDAQSGVADVCAGGGLAFVRNVSGIVDESTGKMREGIHGDGKAQARQAMRNVEALLGKAGVGPDKLLRLDIFLKDIYAQDEVLAELKSVWGRSVPALSFLGCDTRHGAEIEISALAGAK